ncbi:MAG: nitroreductase/quinone reductase family protein [Chloroflexaceae bacterium]|jgi:hypothetical protein|nr:nitroreductase/quinone reductase family protein [Chloroflexaceae bacterium]
MTSSTTTENRRPPRLVYMVVNPLMSLLLRSPLHGRLSGRMLLLQFTGRKSGKRYRFPVGYKQVGDTLFVTTNSGWQKNLRGGVPVNIWLRGQQRRATADVTNDENEMREGYRQMLAGEPQLSQIIGVKLDADGSPNAADLARARQRGYVIVKLKLV